MQISDLNPSPPRSAWLARSARPASAAAAAAAVLLSSLLQASLPLAQDSPRVDAQFHTFVPAAPSAESPSSSDLSLWRNDMKQARMAYHAKDFGTARAHLEAALANGHILAAWHLGHIWRIGLGVEADQSKAVAYYRQVAMGYDPMEPRPGALDMTVDSLVRLGDYYRDGSQAANIAKDPNRAYRLYSAAAGHGHPGAQFGLGMMYLKGTGVRQNTGQALKWMLYAARKRFAPAEALLGDLYWDGSLVARDRAQAIKWYLLASETVGRDTNPHISARLEAMLDEASDSERLNGRMSAEMWADQFPDARQARQAD
jgi:hypothetical protein